MALLVIGISLVSALFYRLGGWQKGNKLIRRIGCPLLFLGLFWGLKGLNPGIWWAYVLTFGLSAGAMSTYHDYLAPDGSSENWLCWLVTGICYGLVAFPLCWAGVHWYAIISRAVILGVLTMLWSEKTSWDILEESGRGFLYCLTVPILFI